MGGSVMGKTIKWCMLFSLIILVLMALMSCIGQKGGGAIPMTLTELEGIWKGELIHHQRDEGIYDAQMEITHASETCMATVTVHSAQASEVIGFNNLLMEGQVVKDQLYLVNSAEMSENLHFTYNATFVFRDFQKTTLSAMISRQSSDGTHMRTLTDIWLGNLQKWTNPLIEPIFFEDPGLENVVRQAQGFTGEPTGCIFPAQVTGITEINAENKGIISLEGLQHLINLQRLNIKQNHIEDLSPIEDLHQIRLLNCSMNPISDCSPLHHLTQLESLRFYQTQVADLSPLEPLIQLKTLDFADACVQDLSPIHNLVDMTYLNCGYNQINDLSPIIPLINLRSIWLISNQIENIDPLLENSGLGAGDYLDIRNNLLDLSPDSQDMQAIQALIDRGVTVFYLVQ